MLILLKTHARHEFNSIQFIYIKFTVQLHTLIWLVKAALNEIMWPAEKIYKIHWLHYVLNRTYSSKNVHFIKYSISFIIWYYFNLQNQHRPQTNGTFAHANVKKEKKAKPKPNQKNVNQYFLYLNHPIKQLTVTLDQNISKRKTRNRCVFIRHCIEMDTEICRKNRLAKILNLLEMRVNIREREKQKTNLQMCEIVGILLKYQWTVEGAAFLRHFRYENEMYTVLIVQCIVKHAMKTTMWNASQS